MDELTALATLAMEMGVRTGFTDGLGKPVTVGPDTLVAVCAALGAPVESPGDAAEALRAHRATRDSAGLPLVVVAWDGDLPALAVPETGSVQAELLLEDGDRVPLDIGGGEIRPVRPLPPGHHHLAVDASGRIETCTVISAPVHAWRRPGSHRSWGVAAQLAALRSARSRSLGDLADLESLCRWVGDRGGDLVMVLPLLPTFNSEPPEPSPYSAVSRLFWSELMLDLGETHRQSESPGTLDVTAADAEVRAALGELPLPERSLLDDELVRYARFRGAQARLGRNWRDWPASARAGSLEPDHVDADEERFHLVAQTQVRRQLDALKARLDDGGIRLGLDLAVGSHPDGYDPWSRQALFGEGVSVGAPPDAGFPSGQDWGFPPVLPEASRGEGHRYLTATVAHQTALAGVLRVDHIMAWTRLYWIPHGFGKHEGTYVSYPHEELFAILTLASSRHRCEVVGENLGTVPPEIDEALPRHHIRGMYLAQFEAGWAAKRSVRTAGSGAAPSGAPTVDVPRGVASPGSEEIALVGTHDTPTFAGWLGGSDIEERARHGLLEEEAVPTVEEERALAARLLAERLGSRVDDPAVFLAELLEWLGRSDSPLVVTWLEDLWLEERGVNLPGTGSSERPNWQRPMRRLLDEIFADPAADQLIRCLSLARRSGTRSRAPAE